MKRIRLTESELVGLVKKIIKESIPVPLFRRFLVGAHLTTARNTLDDLLQLRYIDEYVDVNGQRVRMMDGQDVLENFKAGTLKPQDQQTVMYEIFRNTTEPQLINGLIDWQITQPAFINAYRNSNETQIATAMSPFIGQSNARLLARRFLQGNNPTPFYPINSFDMLTLPQATQQQADNVYDALRQSFALDKRALKIIEEGKAMLDKIKPTNPNYQNILLSNKATIDKQLADIGIKKELRNWFWTEIKKSPASKFAFHLTWSIALLSSLAFIYAMFDVSGISAAGRGLEAVFGEEIVGNARSYGCRIGMKFLCSDGGGDAPDPVYGDMN